MSPKTSNKKVPQMFEVISGIGVRDKRWWLKDVDYQLCSSIDQLRSYTSHGTGVFGEDWETNTLDLYSAAVRVEPVGFSVSVAEGSALYVPMGHQVDPHLNLPFGAVIEHLQQLDAAKVVGGWYNAKYDGEFMHRTAQWEPEYWEDPLLAVWLSDSNLKTLSLKPTTKRLFGVDLIQFEEVTETVLGEHVNFAQLSPWTAVPYASGDADYARRVHYHPRIVEARRDQAFIYEIEKKIIPAIRAGLRAGWYLDDARLAAIIAELGDETTGRIGATRRAIFEVAGFDFNDQLNSPQKLGTLLVERLGVPILERTPKTQQVETGKEVLQRYADLIGPDGLPLYPICKHIIEFREMQAFKTNYAEKLHAAVTHFGTPHFRFACNTAGAPTGRMSSGGDDYDSGFVPVNGMAIPDPDKEKEKPNPKPNLRAVCTANDPRGYPESAWLPEGYAHRDRPWVLVSADFSQIEMRIAGNLSGEESWIEAYKDPDGDIHTTNARKAYNDPTITKDNTELRGKGKTMGFAVLYQAMATTVAAHGRISIEAAQGLIDTFYANVPRLRAWIEDTKAFCRGNSYAKTYFGRIRPLRDYFGPRSTFSLIARGEREGVNMPIQGSAADVFKIAIYKSYKMTRERGWTDRVLNVWWVHDELVYRVHRTVLDEALPAIVGTLEFPVKGWPIPMRADLTLGWDWGHLSEVQTWYADVEARPAPDLRPAPLPV